MTQTVQEIREALTKRKSINADQAQTMPRVQRRPEPSGPSGPALQALQLGSFHVAP